MDGVGTLPQSQIALMHCMDDVNYCGTPAKVIVVNHCVTLRTVLRCRIRSKTRNFKA
jgi:hypothetical protein